MPRFDPDALAAGLAQGDRAALARSITLVESRHPAHRPLALDLLARLASAPPDGARVAISGAPGAGKSTLIEALGMAWLGQDRRVAVLAVDPSSTLSRGSILGDKSRMERLARAPGAFVRPSPTGGHLGGVAVRTRETLRIVEAAGFSHVLIETVGVGQSETSARDLADVFVFAAQPGAGDDVQGIKRGIMEHADLFAVTKRDLLPDAAAAAVRSLRSALAILPSPHPDALAHPQRVFSLSSTTGEGIDVLSDRIDQAMSALRSSGRFGRRRAAQAVGALEPALLDALTTRLRAHPGYADARADAERAIAQGAGTAEAAARLLDRLLGLGD
jgi:LAO/AO transport system kinase